jgi:cell wall-associated NlpC family hydrolase
VGFSRTLRAPALAVRRPGWHGAAVRVQTDGQERSQLRPGDLAFYYRDIHHVARYAGDGRVIEAPQAGEQVSIHPIDFAPIYGYGRVS